MQTDKILLVLDLDETLIHASHAELDRPSDLIVFNFHVYKRPFLVEFLYGCAKHFEMAIWSSASEDYVKAIVEQIVPADIPLKFIWGRSKCTFCMDTSRIEMDGYVDFYKHWNYVKDLKKLKKKGFKLEKILIVDDTPFKAKRNYGNAVYVKEYVGQKHDHELPILLKYLESLKDRENVRNIEKRFWRK